MKFVVVTNSSAPYRDELYRFVGEACQEEGDRLLLVEGGRPRAHAWDDKKREDEASLDYVRLNGLKLPASILKLLRLSTASTGGVNVSLLTMWKTLRSHKPDVIWIHELPPICLCSVLYGFLFRKPIVMSTELGASNIVRYRRITSMLHRIVGGFLSGTIANSPAARVAVSPSLRERLLVYAPHAIDTRKFPDGRSARERCNEVTILFVGSLSHRKGIDVVLSALAEIRESFPELKVRLRLVGGGDTTWIENSDVLKSLSDVVDFIGFCQGSELVAQYDQSDIFVLPSRYDTYGVVGHEAASAGLPLVISSNAGVSETLVEEGKNGFVFENENSSELAKKLVTLINSSSMRQEFGLHSRRMAVNFCVREQAVSIFSALKEVSAKNEQE